MDLHQRRALLNCSPNPDPVRDYVILLSGHVDGSGAGSVYDLRIQYVPDRLIISPQSLSHYFGTLSQLNCSSLEEITTTILGDIQNELVPRWVQVAAELEIKSLDHLNRQISIAEDAQPGWQNDNLLNRLTSD